MNGVGAVMSKRITMGSFYLGTRAVSVKEDNGGFVYGPGMNLPFASGALVYTYDLGSVTRA